MIYPSAASALSFFGTFHIITVNRRLNVNITLKQTNCAFVRCENNQKNNSNNQRKFMQMPHLCRNNQLGKRHSSSGDWVSWLNKLNLVTVTAQCLTYVLCLYLQDPLGCTFLGTISPSEDSLFAQLWKNTHEFKLSLYYYQIISTVYMTFLCLNSLSKTTQSTFNVWL